MAEDQKPKPQKKEKPAFEIPELPKVDLDTLTPEQLAFYKEEKEMIELCVQLAGKLEKDPKYIPLASEEPAFDRLMGTDKIEAASVIRDPSRGRAPTKILCHPPGKRLYWSTPRLRDETGWNNLHPVTYEDPIGREIMRYVPEVPKMLEGSQKREGYIRRGDAVLAWIEEGIWKARQQQREDRSFQRVEEVAQHENVSANGAKTYGEGLRDEPRPMRGFIPGKRSGRQAAEAHSEDAPNQGEVRKRILPGAGEKF
jgi:hypothetical protein